MRVLPLPLNPEHLLKLFFFLDELDLAKYKGQNNTKIRFHRNDPVTGTSISDFIGNYPVVALCVQKKEHAPSLVLQVVHTADVFGFPAIEFVQITETDIPYAAALLTMKLTDMNFGQGEKAGYAPRGFTLQSPEGTGPLKGSSRFDKDLLLSKIGEVVVNAEPLVKQFFTLCVNDFNEHFAKIK